MFSTEHVHSSQDSNDFIMAPAVVQENSGRIRRFSCGGVQRLLQNLRQQAPHFIGHCSKLNQVTPSQTCSMGRLLNCTPAKSRSYSLFDK